MFTIFFLLCLTLSSFALTFTVSLCRVFFTSYNENKWTGSWPRIFCFKCLSCRHIINGCLNCSLNFCKSIDKLIFKYFKSRVARVIWWKQRACGECCGVFNFNIPNNIPHFPETKISKTILVFQSVISIKFYWKFLFLF